MMKYYIFLFYLFWGNLFYTQNKITDTLSTLSYKELKSLFDHYYESDNILTTNTIAKKYLQKAKKEKNNTQIAEGYILVQYNQDFPLALKYLDSLDIITKNINGSQYPTRTYLMKGNLYFKYDYLKKALDNYIIGLNYAKENQDEKQTAFANINIAYLNNYLGKYTESTKIFRYYLYNRNKDISESQYNQIRISLINGYIELNKIDSATILIREGLKSTFTSKSKYAAAQYSYFSGYSYLKQKKYSSAVIELLKAYKFFLSIEDNNVNYALYSLGKSYNGLEKKDISIQYFKRLDSNIQKTNITFPELREVYTYLIDYYKEKNDQEKQLYYIDRFLKVDKKLDDQFRYLSTELPKKYDTPNLLEEKENIISALERRKIMLYISVSALLIIISWLAYLYYKSKKTEKQYRKIAHDLVRSVEQSIEAVIVSDPVSDENDNKENKKTEIFVSPDKITKTTPEEISESILKQLENFENKKHYLKKGVTMANLAKNLKTNTAYLSDVINSHKGKNFAAYLNDLRIDYALKQLVQDKKICSYKLSAIAEELGYNTEQSFSIAFKKKTGTTLTIYIKEIENTKEQQ